MTAPRFASITEGEFRRLKADDQQEIYWEADKLIGDGKSGNRNAALRWATVNAAKRIYWDSLCPSAKRLEPTARAAPGTLTASEVDAWLATLPGPKFFRRS